MASTQHILDTEEGLERLMGDNALYRQLLLRFRKDYGQAATQIDRMLDDGAHAAALRKAHNLKGAAGMIGALELHRLAGAAEAALAALTLAPENGAATVYKAALAMAPKAQPGLQAAAPPMETAAAPQAGRIRLHEALDSLLGVIQSYLDGTLEGAEASRRGTPPVLPPDAATRELLARLAQLLDDGNGAAIDVLEQSATALAAALGVAMFQEVASAAHEFDFETALALLSPALSA